MKKVFLPLITMPFLISACCSWNYSPKDFEFTQEELAHLGPYQEGDTIYFENSLGNMDTLTVLKISEEREEGNKCFISKPPYHGQSIVIKHLPDDQWAGITQVEGGEKKIEYQSLITLSKYPLKKKTDYFVSFRGFSSVIDSTFGVFDKECQVAGKIINNCYKLKHAYLDRVVNPTDIEVVYWTDKYGLTAYTTKNGEVWLLKKLK